jgi:hypothetical protein
MMVLENVPFLVKFQKIHFLGKILACQISQNKKNTLYAQISSSN